MPEKMIAKGRIIEVTARIVPPETATTDQVDDWIHAGLFSEGGLRLDNPLIKHECDEAFDIDWTDTHRYQTTMVKDVQQNGKHIEVTSRSYELHDDRNPEEIESWKSEADVLSAARQSAKQ